MRILGVDPGSQRHAWAVLDVEGRKPGVYVAHGIEEDVDQMVLLLSAWTERLRDPNPASLVALETPTHYIPRSKGKDGATFAQASALMLQQRHVGELVRAAKDRHLERVELTAGQWRVTVVGIAGAKDTAVAAALSTLIVGMPKRCNSHARDAMGVALAAGWGTR